MKDVGRIRLFLGLETARNRENRKLFLSHTCVSKILEPFGLSECSCESVPMQESQEYHFEMFSEAPCDSCLFPYEETIGLMYLMLGTPPEIAVAVRTLVQFCANLAQEHWLAWKPLLKLVYETAAKN